MRSPTAYPLFDIRQQIIGIDTAVPRFGGAGWAVNLDNAATTPALRPAHAAATRFLDWYGSVHRGAGLKAQAAGAVYEEARAIVGRFVGARPDAHVVVFTRNTTEALNLLARRLALRPGELIISTELEHHANDLPWRAVAPVLHARVTADGALDEAHLAELLRRHAGRVRLLAVSGGSNVTGHMPDLGRLAALAHAHGAQIAVDAAQLAAHRPIDMGEPGAPEAIDYLALSGHKLYAPHGCGALIGRRELFAEGPPLLAGGGAVRRVSAEAVEWADAPAREEAGTPNALGAVALAAALATLDAIGLEAIAAHEADLTARALEGLGRVPGLRIYGDPDPDRADTRLGVIPFALAGQDPHLTAAILSYEHGIAVRSGSFCAQPYVRRLLGAEAGCGAGEAGLVRASLGIYTAPYEVELLAEALAAIARGRHADYLRGPDGYRPRDWYFDPAAAFSFEIASGSRLAAPLPRSLALAAD